MIPQAIELVEMIPVDLFLDWKIMKAENKSNIFRSEGSQVVALSLTHSGSVLKQRITV